MLDLGKITIFEENHYHMNPANFPQNGLPKELMSLPYGEIFILTNPNIGISSKNIFMMQFIFSMARQYGKKHIVKERPVGFSGLWDCVACNIKGMRDDQLLIADKDSLVELLCEFWELNYEEVCKTINIPSRNKEITCGSESHPVKITLIPSKKEGALTKKDDFSFTLHCKVDASRERTMERLKEAFQEMFSHKVDVSMEDISDLYEEVKKNRKTYKLNIQIKDKEGNSFKKLKTCDISLIDNYGTIYPFVFEPLWKALYLTFILFKDGIPEMDVSDSAFYELFLKIQDKLSRNSKLPSKESILSNTKSNLSKIRGAILNATNDVYAKEQFAVDGYSGDVYLVAGSTDEDRTLIRREFGLE